MADPNITPIGCYGQKFRFGSVPFTRSSCTQGLDKAVLLLAAGLNLEEPEANKGMEL